VICTDSLPVTSEPLDVYTVCMANRQSSADRASPSQVANLHHGHAIVAGFGIVGRMVAQQLEQAGLNVTLIELNKTTIERQKPFIRQLVYGDVRDPETLREARIDKADVLILAIPDEEQAVAACRVARELNPHIFIAARTNFFSKGMLASQAGADVVVVEEVVTARAMQQAVLEQLLEKKEAGDDT